MNAENSTTPEEAGRLFANPLFWGSVIGGATDIMNSFNYKKQENDIQLASANAQAMSAQYQLANIPRETKSNVIWIIATIAIVVVIVIIISKKK